MKKAAVKKKSMAQYGFGTGLVTDVAQMAGGFLLNSATQGLNTIFSGGLPNADGDMFDFNEGGQILAFGGMVEGPGDPPVKKTKTPASNVSENLKFNEAGTDLAPNYTPTDNPDIYMGKFGVPLSREDYNTSGGQGYEKFNSFEDWADYYGGWVKPPAPPVVVPSTKIPLSDKAKGLDNNYNPARYQSTPSGQARAAELKKAADATHNPNNYYSHFSLGGTTGAATVEVEGDEVAETPDGQLLDFEGPSHEAGGIDVTLPEGTKIYSDRISIDGKTMQERKKSRENKMNKLGNLLAKNPTDVISKNTFNRTKIQIDAEEQHDLAIQELANQIKKNKNDGKKAKFAFGTDDLGIDDGLIGVDVPQWNPEPTTPQIPRNWYMGMTPESDTLPNAIGHGITMNTTPSVGNSIVPKTPTIKTPVNTDMPYTTGDKMGFLGNLLSGVAPLATTIANRAGDKPNINPYKNFGKNAIVANGQAMDAVNASKDSVLQDIDLQATGQRARNRNSATGVNTLRALDLATSAGTNAAKTKASSAYSQQIAGLYGQKSGLLNQQDSAMAEGIAMADKGDRADRDAYYTNLSKNLGHIASVFQKTGKEVNEHQQNNDILRILPELSKYGLGYIYDETGKPVLTKVK